MDEGCFKTKNKASSINSQCERWEWKKKRLKSHGVGRKMVLSEGSVILEEMSGISYIYSKRYVNYDSMDIKYLSNKK